MGGPIGKDLRESSRKGGGGSDQVATPAQIGEKSAKIEKIYFFFFLKIITK